MQMSPYLSTPNQADQRHRDAVVSRDEAQDPCIGADSSRLGFGKLRVSISRAAKWALSALRVTISHVVGVGSKEQMIGIDAGSNVAGMADVHSVWNGAVMYLPRHLVRSPRSVGVLKSAVATGIDEGLPQPARIGTARAINLRPKSLFYTGLSHLTSLGSVVRGAVRIPVLPRLAIVREEMAVC